LLDAGAKPNDLDSSGRPPLLVAAKNNTFLQSSDRYYPDVQQEPKAFWITVFEKDLNPWTVDINGESVFGSLINSECFVLAKALVEVACEKIYLQSDTIAVSLLNAICKDSSTRAHWKSTLVEIILKSRKSPISVKSKDDTPLHYCCRNIVRKSEDSSVHWTIAKLLLSYGADSKIPNANGQTCLDIADTHPELKELLGKPINIEEVPLFIPWLSVSKKYKPILAKAARRQECEHFESFWYHKKHLESGSFGFVFAGINENDGREVAIKRIEKLRMQRQEEKREITNLTALADCEQVVRYLSFFEDKHFCYVVLELMEGNLDEYLDSTYDMKESVTLCEDVVKGLEFLHGRNILHRDLKPTNILYKSYPKLCLKIADFGLSRRTDSTQPLTTVYGTNVGTRCWIAPEVLKSRKEHSPFSDIFACGLVFHYIFSVKKHPFSPADCVGKGFFEVNNATENNILNDKMEGLDNSLSPEAALLVEKMLECDKSKRPSASEALVHPLFWSKKKKIDLLIAVGNQNPEFTCPRAKRSPPLSAVEMDLENGFGTILKFPKWDDPRNKHMPDNYSEKTKQTSPYDTFSLVELVRFIRNAYAHVTETSQPNLLLKDFVFLEYFPNLVTEVFKAVTTHGWDQTRDEVITVIN
jgi:serine/threonine protein kinase